MATDITNEIDYPTSDGKRLADTRLTYSALVLLFESLLDFFLYKPDVFVPRSNGRTGCKRKWSVFGH